MEDVEETDNVGILHFLEEGDLANGCAGNTFIFGFEADFLECDNAPIVEKIACLEDDTVGAYLRTMSVL